MIETGLGAPISLIETGLGAPHLAQPHQVRLNLVPEARISFIFEPAGYRLHLWDEEGGLVAHTAVLGHWAGPAGPTKRP